MLYYENSNYAAVYGTSARRLLVVIFLNSAPNHPELLTTASRKPHHIFRKFAPLPYYRIDL